MILTCGIVETDDEERLRKTEELVYNYLDTAFGADAPTAQHVSKPIREDIESKALRVAKKTARRAKKAATKEKDVPGLEVAKQEYLRLVRLHNKSRRNELRKKRKKESVREQEKFKKNP